MNASINERVPYSSATIISNAARQLTDGLVEHIYVGCNWFWVETFTHRICT